LLLENTRLAKLVSRSQATETQYAPAVDLTDYYERRLYEVVGNAYESRIVACIDDIALPSQSCSSRFVDFADTWTSWVHFAFFFPEFLHEHKRFWQKGGSFQLTDPLWLAVYFAALASALGFMSEEDFVRSGAPLETRIQLTRNWFSAALFYLDRGDFLQKSHIYVVQAIVVLGNVVGTPSIQVGGPSADLEHER
jgi:hypothetical protein